MDILHCVHQFRLKVDSPIDFPGDKQHFTTRLIGDVFKFIIKSLNSIAAIAERGRAII